MKIGIAICTFNRVETLLETLKKIQINTKSPHEIIVVDDGSSDKTVDELKKTGVKFLSCRNRGIAWNKNRAIFYLKNFTKSDIIIVFEDDTFPIEPHWEDRWINGISLWGHINLAARYWGTEGFHDGDGSPERPFKSHHVSAQCAGFSPECIDYVGYMDSRFRSYGMEHVEHTNRMLQGGYGGELLNDTKRQIYYLIDSPMEILFRDTSVGLDDESRNKAISKNIEICIQIQHDKIKRDPWINDEEMCVFLSEYNKFRKKELYFSIKNSEGLILCFDSSCNKIIFLSLENLFPLGRFKKIICYYDGNRLKLYTKNKNDINALKFISLSNIAIGKISPEAELEFDIILDEKKGMYLFFDGFYASCEKNNGNLFSLNRKIPFEWERFYFCCFELN